MSQLQNKGLDGQQVPLVAEIRSFLAEHWPDRRAGARRDAGAGFIRALSDRGWSVPDWPREQGGQSWSAAQRYLFDRELALAGAPSPDSFAVNVLGPLLIAAGTVDQRDRLLPLIREGRLRCSAHTSVMPTPVGSAATPLRMTGDLNRPRLLSERVYTRGARGADWLLARAEQQQSGPSPGAVLVLVPLRSATVSPGLPLDPDHVEVTGVIPEVIGDSASLPVLAELLNRAEQVRRARVPRLTGWLDDLVGLIDPHSLDGEGDGAGDAALRRQVDELRIDLLGLDALEQRVMTAVLPGDDQSARESMVRLRCAELARAVAELAINSLGYYALPAVDPLLHDNELPPGRGSGQGAIEELFRYVGGLEVMTDRDGIAATILEN